MLDVYDQLHAEDSAKIVFHNQNGKKIALVDFGNEIKKINGEGAIIVQREEIIERLVEKVKSNGTTVEFGKKLVDIIESENKVTAIFEDGTKDEGDFLIGVMGCAQTLALSFFPIQHLPHTRTWFLLVQTLANQPIILWPLMLFI